MLNNLAGWHFAILIGVLVLAAVVVLVIAVVAARTSRREPSRPAVSSPDEIEQIQRLGQLRDDGLISQAEYDQKRSELLGRI